MTKKTEKHASDADADEAKVRGELEQNLSDAKTEIANLKTIISQQNQLIERLKMVIVDSALENIGKKEARAMEQLKQSRQTPQ